MFMIPNDKKFVKISLNKLLKRENTKMTWTKFK